MKPSDIVAHVRVHCPGFARNVAAGVNWEAIAAATQLPKRAAYVVLVGIEPSELLSETPIVQALVSRVIVIVAFPQVKGDESGYGVADEVDAVFRELCRALVGWTPPGCSAPLLFDGLSIEHQDRTKAVYYYSFSATETLGNFDLPSTLEEAETWEELELLGLPDLKGIDINVDLIDPIVDQSLLPEGQHHGPDGRIEHQLKKDFPHE